MSAAELYLAARSGGHADPGRTGGPRSVRQQAEVDRRLALCPEEALVSSRFGAGVRSIVSDPSFAQRARSLVQPIATRARVDTVPPVAREGILCAEQDRAHQRVGPHRADPAQSRAWWQPIEGASAPFAS